MRSSLLLLVVAACSSQQSSEPKEPKGHPGTLANVTSRTCKEAALGIESATRGVRDPDNSVVGPLTVRCGEDTWQIEALECFATMREGDLGKCGRLLSEASRSKLFAVLGGYGDAPMFIAIAHARLEQLNVGVQACDAFVNAVASVLACDRVPIDIRVQLGHETADFWALPTSKLAVEDVQRMSVVCGESLASLTQQATSAGCP